MPPHYIIINNTYHFTITPYLLDMYSSAVLLNNILLLLLLLLPLLTMPAAAAAANGVVVPESNDSAVISSSSISSALTNSLSSGRIMSAVNDVLSLLGLWGDSDTDGDMAGVVMTGMWSLSLIKFGVGDLFLNCGSVLPNKVLKT